LKIFCADAVSPTIDATSALRRFGIWTENLKNSRYVTLLNFQYKDKVHLIVVDKISMNW